MRFWPACVIPACVIPTRVIPICVIAVVSLAAWAARAQDSPKLFPDRDADVSYRVTDRSDNPVQQRVRWLAAAHLLRREGPGRGFTLVDHKAGYITIVSPRTKSYLKVEEPAGGLFTIDATGAVTKGGASTVARLACTEWNWVDKSTQQPRTVCLTDDGVMLRVTEAGRTLIEATAVTYRQVNPKTFQIPAGYEPTLIPDTSGE